MPRAPRLSYTPSDEVAWDKLWVFYFQKEPQQLATQKELTIDTLPATRDAFIEDPALFIHCDASALEDKTVLEIGCGCGWLAKHVAAFTKTYIGIDWSGLALLVASRTCEKNSVWLHAKDHKQIRKLAGTVDTVIFRNFIIHQDFEHCTNILAFSRAMLAPGGKIFADFWYDEASSPTPGVLPATDATVGRRSNSCFRYTDDEVSRVGHAAGLVVADAYKRPDMLRNFVTFTKP